MGGSGDVLRWELVALSIHVHGGRTLGHGNSRKACSALWARLVAVLDAGSITLGYGKKRRAFRNWLHGCGWSRLGHVRRTTHCLSSARHERRECPVAWILRDRRGTRRLLLEQLFTAAALVFQGGCARERRRRVHGRKSQASRFRRRAEGTEPLSSQGSRRGGLWLARALQEPCADVVGRSEGGRAGRWVS